MRKGYVEHPQILFGAVGDATCDRVPLQVGQFESDNRMDDDLGRILLEGGGGGQMTESYELAMYFMARHTAIDCLDKRGRRGYLFIIGDELRVPEGQGARGREDHRRRPGRGHPDGRDRRRAQAPVRRLLHPPRRHRHSAGERLCSTSGARLLGQNVIELDDLDAVCETIALTVGLGEEAIDLDEGLVAPAGVGSAAGTSVSRALAPLGSGRGAVAVSAAPTGLDPADTEVTRL